MAFQNQLKNSTVLCTMVGAGLVMASALVATPTGAQAATLATTTGAGAVPTLPAAKSRNGQVHLTACRPCAPNPCAANPCAANPCAANPCAANPCAANPCAANPCAANPCAANPCAANPCAANPCAANPCAPGAAVASRCFVPRLKAANPCAPAGDGGLTADQAKAAYACVSPDMFKGYEKADILAVRGYQAWTNVAKHAYQSATHGGRYVNNYVNEIGAKEYQKFEKAMAAPVGTVLAKDSFSLSGKGGVSPGPLFIMEKMPAGFNPGTGNWRYSMVLPNGQLFGATNGKNSAGTQFCVDCHVGAEETDYMFFLEEEYRK